MKKAKLIAVSPALFLISSLLSGCGGELQDEGAVSSNQIQYNGVAIDGALARATVYLDSNNNSTRDPWEDSAFTDNDGYYSYNPKTQKDYCSSSAPDSERIYCLRSARSYTDVVVRIDGGYDLLTGEPFMGQMSRRVDMSEVTDSVDAVVSPLSTLLTNVTSSEERNNVLNALRINGQELNVNYVDTDNEGGINAKLLNASLKVHKTVTVLSDRLNDTYSALNDETGVMNDPSAEIYKNLAKELGENSIEGLDFVLSDTTALTRVMDRSEDVLRELFEEKELILPEDMGSVEEPKKFSRAAQVGSSIANVVDQLINPEEVTSIDAVGGARALEALVIKSVNEGLEQDTSIEAAVNFMTNFESRDLVASLTQALVSDLADVTGLSGNDFSGGDFDSTEDVQMASRLPETAQAFSTIAGKQFKVSDLDLGSANALKDIEIEFYFNGSEGDIDGQFTACAKYIEDATTTQLGDGNTHGELVTGYWSMLGATLENQQSYSLLLTIEFLGATYQAIMKTVGTTVISDTVYNQVRFDNSGEYRIWHSLDGIVVTQNLPSTNVECEQRLPSRVGL